LPAPRASGGRGLLPHALAPAGPPRLDSLVDPLPERAGFSLAALSGRDALARSRPGSRRGAPGGGVLPRLRPDEASAGLGARTAADPRGSHGRLLLDDAAPLRGGASRGPRRLAADGLLPGDPLRLAAGADGLDRRLGLGPRRLESSAQGPGGLVLLGPVARGLLQRCHVDLEGAAHGDDASVRDLDEAVPGGGDGSEGHEARPAVGGNPGIVAPLVEAAEATGAASFPEEIWERAASPRTDEDAAVGRQRGEFDGARLSTLGQQLVHGAKGAGQAARRLGGFQVRVVELVFLVELPQEKEEDAFPRGHGLQRPAEK